MAASQCWEMAPEGEKTQSWEKSQSWEKAPEKTGRRPWEKAAPERLALAAAAAGATGAAVTTIIFFPVELIKNRLQASGPGGGFAYAGLVDGLLTVLREEGFQGLFAGFRPVLFRAVAFDFSTIFWGELFVQLRRQGLKAAGDYSVYPVWELALRTAGGWATTAALLPLETVSTRCTVSRPAIGGTAAIKELWMEGGTKAFWRGLKVMLMLCLNPAMSFTAFEQLKGLLLAFLRRRSRESSASSASSWELLSWPQAFGVGVIAKMLTLCSIYPLIRGKFLLQASDRGTAGLRHVLREAVASDGIWSLYRGLGAQLSKSLLSSALLLSIKERTEAHWQRVFIEPAPCAWSPPLQEGAQA